MGRTAEDTEKGSLSPHAQRSTYQLVRDVSMVLSGHSFSNSRFHQPGKRGQHIDRWVNLGWKRKKETTLCKNPNLTAQRHFKVTSSPHITQSKGTFS